MTRNATWLEAALAFVVLCVVLSVYLDHTRGRNEAKLATLHTHTVVAETLLVEKKGEAAKAVTVYRTLRDTLLTRLTDTVRVKEVLARADTVIAKDSVALQAADAVIAAKDDELREAKKPIPAPRLLTTVAALYDPLSGQPSGSAGVSLRVLGGLALTARAEQRPVLERPAVRVGVSYTF